MEIECWFDGACNPNPYGAMGYGAYIVTPFDEMEFFDGALPSENNSNNVAEYMGLKRILTYLEENDFPLNTKVIIKGDSNLVSQQMNGEWKIKNGMYKDVAKDCQMLLKSLQDRYDIKISWVRREENEIADELSKMGMDIYMTV